MTLHIIVLVSLKGSVVYAAVKSLINLGLPISKTHAQHETLYSSLMPALHV